ncbi:MAG: isoprenylcysteine carboxylmethyltransferase family protein [Candidatus Omnitrophica bacterium]|nr:isoprenylcysteine carboxylmethyltransferase family protein [Candidatus Omnitrophota bacterium]
MKKRIKIDTTILAFIITLTAVLYYFPGLYIRSETVDTIFDFFGFLLILKGVLLRMSARGHKKAFSSKSASLVTTGPYQLVRNPMYLGTCLIGAGYVLMIWPWWVLPIFIWLFYVRFNKQVVIEEEYLLKSFGSEYERYCRKVPRIFPDMTQVSKIKLRKYFSKEEALSTKEKRGLVWWPVLAVALESLQEMYVYGQTNVLDTIIMLSVFGGAFFVIFYFYYRD